jgi:hypothetical protein
MQLKKGKRKPPWLLSHELRISCTGDRHVLHLRIAIAQKSLAYHGGGDCQMPSQRGGQQQNTSPKLCAGYITSIQQLRLLPVQPGIITYTKTTKQKLQPLSSSRMNLRGVQLTDPWPTNQPKPAPPVGAELVFHRRKDSDGAALRSGRMDESPPERRMILSKIGCLIDR